MEQLQPYPAYKDSGVPWLGRVPEHWEVRRVKRLFHYRKDLNTLRTERNVLSLTLRGVVNNDPDDPEGLVPRDYASYQVFERDDLVFKLIDLENFRTSRVGVVHERGIMSPAYVRLSLTTEGNIRFCFHQFFDLYLRGIYNQIGAGVRSTLGPSDLLNLGIVLPPSVEQAGIVRFLDRQERMIRTYIRAKQNLIALLNEQKQAIIQRAVTRGLNPDVKLKPSGVEWLGDIPEHWEVRRLKDGGKVQTGITLGKQYPGGGLVRRPYLRVANVQSGFLDLKKVKTVDVPLSEAMNCELRPGDVLMTEGGDIDKLGRGHVWNGEIPGCLHQNHIFAVRLETDKIRPEYLVLMMASKVGRDYFQLTAKQTTNLASTNRSKIRAFPFPLPRVSEQDRILSLFRKESSPVDGAISRAEREIALLREYRTRLIADVVTGKLDVREAAACLEPSADTGKEEEGEEAEPADMLGTTEDSHISGG